MLPFSTALIMCREGKISSDNIKIFNFERRIFLRRVFYLLFSFRNDCSKGLKRDTSDFLSLGGALQTLCVCLTSFNCDPPPDSWPNLFPALDPLIQHLITCFGAHVRVLFCFVFCFLAFSELIKGTPASGGYNTTPPAPPMDTPFQKTNGEWFGFVLFAFVHKTPFIFFGLDVLYL